MNWSRWNERCLTLCSLNWCSEKLVTYRLSDSTRSGAAFFATTHTAGYCSCAGHDSCSDPAPRTATVNAERRAKASDASRGCQSHAQGRARGQTERAAAKHLHDGIVLQQLHPQAVLLDHQIEIR